MSIKANLVQESYIGQDTSLCLKFCADFRVHCLQDKN
jgi:hypothetical protein